MLGGVFGRCGVEPALKCGHADDFFVERIERNKKIKTTGVCCWYERRSKQCVTNSSLGYKGRRLE